MENAIETAAILIAVAWSADEISGLVHKMHDIAD